jgi:hypothetical protein
MRRARIEKSEATQPKVKNQVIPADAGMTKIWGFRVYFTVKENPCFRASRSHSVTSVSK